MALLRVWAFRRLGKTVNDFFISRHLFPDGELWIGKNLVFVGNVLPPVVVFDKLAAVGKKKTAFDKAAIFIDPHIPAIRLIIEIVPQVFGNVDHFHVLRINAAQGFIIGHLGIGHLIEEGRVRRTILSALKDAGIEVPCRLDIPDEDEERLKRLGNRAYPQGEENTLEEFVWAFGQDSEHEIEKRALHVISLIRTKEDVVKLSEKGVDRLVSSWGYLGALDEDLLLRSITDHVESFPEELAEEAEKIFELIDVRRRKLRDRLLREHPEMTEYLEESREHRIGNSVCIG